MSINFVMTGNCWTYDVSGLPDGASFTPDTQTIAWMPGFDDSGDYTITVSVTDNGNPVISDEETITISVINVNRPPVLDAVGNRTINENEALAFTLTGSDPDGDSIMFSAAYLPGGAAFNPDTRTFTWTPDFQATGNYTVVFKVTDSGFPALSDEETVAISVGDVNRPPAFTEIGNKTVNEGELLTFSISASDPDNDDLTYAAADLPDGAVFDVQAKNFAWTPGYETAGDHKVSFTVTDNGNPEESETETITITVVNGNRPPELEPVGNQTVAAETELALTLSATDPDGNDLTYTFTGLPAGALFDSETRILSWTPDATQIGEHTIIVSVTDNGTPQRVATETVLVTVTEKPTLPQQPSGGSGSSGSCFIGSVF